MPPKTYPRTLFRGPSAPQRPSGWRTACLQSWKTQDGVRVMGPRAKYKGRQTWESFRKMNTNRTVRDRWDKQLGHRQCPCKREWVSRQEAGGFTEGSQGLRGTHLGSHSHSGELCCTGQVPNLPEPLSSPLKNWIVKSISSQGCL